MQNHTHRNRWILLKKCQAKRKVSHFKSFINCLQSRFRNKKYSCSRSYIKKNIFLAYKEIFCFLLLSNIILIINKVFSKWNKHSSLRLKSKNRKIKVFRIGYNLVSCKIKNTEILTLKRVPFVPYIWINFVETQFWNNISIKKASPKMSRQLIKALFKEITNSSIK